ncbi:hypothetical protein ABZ070_28200 [Streptomyces sp. NPDC006283]|uniref:hypothetical protein n=1 Tax=Streptomyces sp. NPDC006283 TaxID=3156741 RepID=UPI0033B7B1D8
MTARLPVHGQLSRGQCERQRLHATPDAFASLTHALKTGGASPCIDVTHTPDGLVRIGGVVTTTHEKWDAFVLGVRVGEFDHVGR